MRQPVHRTRYPAAVVDEQVQWWQEHGVGPNEAWIALEQGVPYSPRYWPEVRAVMLKWLSSNQHSKSGD